MPTMKTKQKLTLEDFIKLGGFGYVNPNIVPLFKDEPLRGMAVEIRKFDKSMTSEEVIAELAKDGCTPSTATELFAWHSENKDKINKYQPVIALGSVKEFEGERRVCRVWLDDAERYAYLRWFDLDWVADCWFAFSRESAKNSESKPLSSDPLNFEARLEALESFEKKVRAFLILE